MELNDWQQTAFDQDGSGLYSSVQHVYSTITSPIITTSTSIFQRAMDQEILQPLTRSQVSVTPEPNAALQESQSTTSCTSLRQIVLIVQKCNQQGTFKSSQWRLVSSSSDHIKLDHQAESDTMYTPDFVEDP